jgi:hypothetical protein
MLSPSWAHEAKTSLDRTTSLAHPDANISIDANIEAQDVAISRTRARFPPPKGMTERRDILDFPQAAVEAQLESGKPDSRARRFATAKTIIGNALGAHLSKNKTTSYNRQDDDLKKVPEEQEQEQERKDQPA